jgi:hypothetical protein
MKINWIYISSQLWFFLIIVYSQGCSVSIVTRLRAGRPGFDSRQGMERLFLFATASIPAMRPSQPPIEWVPGAFYPGVKRPWCEADHSLSYSTKFKNAWSYTSSPKYVSMAWCLHQGKFTYFHFLKVIKQWQQRTKFEYCVHLHPY